MTSGINQSPTFPSHECDKVTRNDTFHFSVEEGNPDDPKEKAKTERKKQGRMFFPLLLHDIVSEECNSEIIRWRPDGKAFVIVDRKKFCEKILPLHFPHVRKFSSFARKLSRWQFQRVPRGPLIGTYFHESFQRGKRELSRNISFKNRSVFPPNY